MNARDEYTKLRLYNKHINNLDFTQCYILRGLIVGVRSTNGLHDDYYTQMVNHFSRSGEKINE